jgi:hypothetical protein
VARREPRRTATVRRSPACSARGRLLRRRTEDGVRHRFWSSAWCANSVPIVPHPFSRDFVVFTLNEWHAGDGNGSKGRSTTYSRAAAIARRSS